MLHKKVNLNNTFLAITGGSFIATSGEHTGEAYTSLDGTLVDIRRGKSNFSKDDNWLIELADLTHPELRYIISLPYTSGVYVSIVQCLRSALDFLNRRTIIKIDTYKKDGYNKVVVWADGYKLDWYTQEMPIVKRKQAGKYAKDFTERMQFVEGLTSEILKALDEADKVG